MSVINQNILRTLLHWKTHPGKSGLAKNYAGSEPPIRSELFSREQMMRHGKTLAGVHRLIRGVQRTGC